MLLCNWSEVYHLYDRLTEKDMKWQATNSCKSNSVSSNGISRSLRDLTTHLGMKPVWFICHFIFFMSRETLAIPRTKTIAKFVKKWNFKAVWQKFISRRETLCNLKYQNRFFNASYALVFDGIWCQLLPLRNFFWSKISEG